MANGGAVLVAGAGVSASATEGAPFASWDGLLRDGIERACGVLPAEASKFRPWAQQTLSLGGADYWIMVAERITLMLGGHRSGEFQAWMNGTVGALSASSTDVIDAIAALRCPILTTNYDGLFERTLGREACTWQEPSFAHEVIRSDRNDILHLHGYWRQPASIVFGSESYFRVGRDPVARALREGVAATKTIILVGFGEGIFDPTFQSLREFIRTTCEGNARPHYRLVLRDEMDSELTSKLRSERIVSVPYGDRHDDLASFLNQLANGTYGKPESPTRVERKKDDSLAATTGDRWAMRVPASAYVQRSRIDHEISDLLEGPSGGVCVTGIRGAGKSTSVAHGVLSLGQEAFWFSPREGATLDDLVIDLRIAGLELVDSASPRVRCENICAQLDMLDALLIIDDLADADQDGFRLLAETVLQTDAGRCRLVLVARERPDWLFSYQIPGVTVAGLELSEARVMLESSLKKRHIDLETVLPSVVNAIDGHAFGLEIFATLVGDYNVVPADLLADHMAGELRVLKWLSMLLERLPAESLELLNRLAFTRAPFAESLVRRIQESSSVRWRENLGALRDRFVVERVSEDEFRVHSFVAQLIRTRTPQDSATAVHRELSNLYSPPVRHRRKAARNNDELRERFLGAEHSLMAGDVRRAHGLLTSCSGYAKRSGNYAMLIAILRGHREVNPDRSFWLDYDLAHALMITGRYLEAYELLRTLPRPNAAALRVSTARLQADLELELTRSSHGLSHLQRVLSAEEGELRANRRSGQVPHVQALSTLARLESQNGNLVSSRVHLDEVESLIGDDRFSWAVLNANRAVLLGRSLDGQLVQDMLRASSDSFEVYGDRRGWCWSASWLGLLQIESGSSAAGQRLLRSAVSTKRTLGECSLDYEAVLVRALDTSIDEECRKEVERELDRVAMNRAAAATGWAPIVVS